jgi:hypothetical protein
LLAIFCGQLICNQEFRQQTLRIAGRLFTDSKEFSQDDSALSDCWRGFKQQPFCNQYFAGHVFSRSLIPWILAEQIRTFFLAQDSLTTSSP